MLNLGDSALGLDKAYNSVTGTRDKCLRVKVSQHLLLNSSYLISSRLAIIKGLNYPLLAASIQVEIHFQIGEKCAW